MDEIKSPINESILALPMFGTLTVNEQVYFIKL